MPCEECKFKLFCISGMTIRKYVCECGEVHRINGFSPDYSAYVITGVGIKRIYDKISEEGQKDCPKGTSLVYELCVGCFGKYHGSWGCGDAKGYPI